jgi:hypothetical protein
MSIAPPTPSPALVPTPSPSRAPLSSQPTFAPTQQAGWVLIEQFDAENCEGSVTTLSGIPTNYCQVEYDANNHPSGSRKYFCTAGNNRLL